MAKTLDKKSIKILNSNISKKLMNSSDPNDKELLKKKLSRVQYSPQGSRQNAILEDADNQTTSDYYKTSKMDLNVP